MNEIITKYYTFIHSYISKREKNREIVDDLAQEVYCTILEHTNPPPKSVERMWVVQQIKKTVYE